MRRMLAAGAALLALAAGSLASGQEAGNPVVKSAQESKTDFITAFANLDETALDASYYQLVKNFPQDPGLPKFAYELVRLYTYAADLNPSEMTNEATKAEALWREFSPGGRFGDANLPGTQFLHARHLIKMGQFDAAITIYRNLAETPSNAILNDAVGDMLDRISMTPNDVEFWKSTIVKHMAASPKPSAKLKARLVILRQWNSVPIHPWQLQIEALARGKQAEALLNQGQTDQGIEQMRQIKNLLDQYFAAPPAGKQNPNHGYTKFSLAMAESWLGNDRRALDLVNEVVAQNPDATYLAEVKFWQLACEEHLRSVPRPEQETRLWALLGEKTCTTELAAQVVGRLAKLAEERGDEATAQACYRDFARVVPNPALGLWARQKQVEVEKRAPELKQQTTPTLSAMATLFASQNVKAQAPASGPVGGGGPDSFPNWRKPVYGLFEQEQSQQ